MKFCEECNNLLTYKNEGTKLYLICQTCNKKYESNDYIIYHKNNNRKKNIRINTNFIYDPRLPRTNKIKCLNSNCESHKFKENENEIVIYNNSNNMISSYICSTCKHIWSN